MFLRSELFRRLCDARDLLVDDAAETAPTIDEVARAVSMSPAHFTRQFEAVFGETPHQLRIRERLERAKRLLALGRLSVTEVCFEVGFSSLGSFSSLFARRIGQSPSVYQRRMRALVQVPGTLPPRAFPGCLSLMAMAQFSRSAVRET